MMNPNSAESIVPPFTKVQQLPVNVTTPNASSKDTD